LKIATDSTTNRAAWRRVKTEIPSYSTEANELLRWPFGMTTSFDAVRKRALFHWGNGQGGRATGSLDMSGSPGSESYTLLGNDSANDWWPEGLGRLMGSSDVRIILTYGGLPYRPTDTLKVCGVNVDPAVTSANRRIIRITNIAGTIPPLHDTTALSLGVSSQTSFDWVEAAYSGEGAFAVFNPARSRSWPKALWWLKPPVDRSAWQTGQWTWEREDLTGDTLIPEVGNGGRFYWAPKCGVGVWNGEATTGIQVIRSSKVALPTASEIPKQSTGEFLSAAPNPFNASTRIRVNSRYSGTLELRVYDLRGRLVDRIVTSGFKLVQGVDWNAANLTAGLYVMRCNAGKRVLQTTLMLAK
jgi:hypothetical protein